MRRCASCGALIIEADAYCDGVVCSVCGYELHKMPCDGVCDMCVDPERYLKQMRRWVNEGTYELNHCEGRKGR